MTVTRISDRRWLVTSATDPAKVYRVKSVDDQWSCTCPHFTMRDVEECKHIVAARYACCENTYVDRRPATYVVITSDWNGDHRGTAEISNGDWSLDKPIPHACEALDILLSALKWGDVDVLSVTTSKRRFDIRRV